MASGALFHKLAIHLKRFKDLQPGRGLLLLAHAGPDVGVDHLGIGHGGLRVLAQVDPGALGLAWASKAASGS